MQTDAEKKQERKEEKKTRGGNNEPQTTYMQDHAMTFFLKKTVSSFSLLFAPCLSSLPNVGSVKGKEYIPEATWLSIHSPPS
jgi:hypothetical protein